MLNPKNLITWLKSIYEFKPIPTAMQNSYILLVFAAFMRS